MNDWEKLALADKGIEFTKSGKIRIVFGNGIIQELQDLETAIRQQSHIINQQKEEQLENKNVGLLIRKFCDTIKGLENMSMKTFTENRKNNLLEKLYANIDEIGSVRNKLRVDGVKKLKNVCKMIEQNNIPAAAQAANATLDRMRKRWLQNVKVIDISTIRLITLQKLKFCKNGFN